MNEPRARRAADLSHAQKQSLEIGMLLAQHPKLLIVDEPLAGMTDAGMARTALLLKGVAKTHAVILEHGMTSGATSASKSLFFTRAPF